VAVLWAAFVIQAILSNREVQKADFPRGEKWR
jgi:hypothetical protein